MRLLLPRLAPQRQSSHRHHQLLLQVRSVLSERAGGRGLSTPGLRVQNTSTLLCPHCASCTGHPDALVEAEDDLIVAHRQHIEDSMACVREEMNLLGELEGSTGAGEVHQYAQALAELLHRKATAVASLQQRLEQFQTLLDLSAV